MKKLKMTAAAGGATVLALLLGACGAPEGESGTPTPPAATEAPTATETPTAPQEPHLDPPAPYTQPETTEDPWGGIFTDEELDALFLEGVREDPSTPAVRATDDATLLEYGRSVCPAIEAGATFADFNFPDLDPYLDAPIVAGAAVGTFCPDLLEAAMGEAGDYYTEA